MTLRTAPLVALLCVSAPFCMAQRKNATPPPAPEPAEAAAPSPTDKINIKQIVYTGADNYSQDDFAAATGLTPGILTLDTIQKTADTLAASGQFAKVEFAMDDTTLNYKITPPSHPLPVHFENFVWWSEVDLLRELHAKYPLFTGTLGSDGPLEKQLLDTLTAMSSEKTGTPATVKFTLLGKTGQSPVAASYTISSPPIIIKRVDLSHGTLEMSASVADISRRLEGQPFSHDGTREFLVSHLGEAYASNGYIDFSIKDFRAGSPFPDGDGFGVTVSGILDEGPQYHVSALYWTDTPQLNKQTFDSNSTLKVDAVAARGPLNATLHMIEQVYQQQGYVNARASAKPTLDHEHSTVSYTFSVEPGTVFHTD